MTPNGRLFAADAMKGLLAIGQDGKVELLADRVAPGDPIRYANAVVVARGSTVYFTDSSARFAPGATPGGHDHSAPATSAIRTRSQAWAGSCR